MYLLLLNQICVDGIGSAQLLSRVKRTKIIIGVAMASNSGMGRNMENSPISVVPGINNENWLQLYQKHALLSHCNDRA